MIKVEVMMCQLLDPVKPAFMQEKVTMSALEKWKMQYSMVENLKALHGR